jgi:protein transport protein SEC24
MMVVSDITDVLIPLPEDILVNLGDSRAVVEALLDSLPTMFKSSTAPSSCTGKAGFVRWDAWFVCGLLYRLIVTNN